MNPLNAFLTTLCHGVMYALGWLPGWLILIVWAVLGGVLAGVAFRYTSNQKALTALGDRIRADLLGSRLFKDELGVTLRCQLDLLIAAGLRAWYALPALTVMLIPFVLLLTQLALHFEQRPLQPGESAVVELKLAPDQWEQASQVQLKAPPQLAVETPPLRDQRQHTVYWRIRPQVPGSFSLQWELGGSQFEKDVVVAQDTERLALVSAQRGGTSFLDRMLHPGEPAFPSDSAIQASAVHYPRRSTPIFGFDIPWWATFLIASILSAFILRPVLKVRF